MADKALLTKKLGRYDIVRVIGKGAMGVVYEGRDPNLDRKVAIKTIVTDSLSSEAAEEFAQRFRTEARSAARLQHPNIVSVYDADRDGDVQFIVMEYVAGEDLKYHIDMGNRYPLERSVNIICELLSALQYAHERKVIHRDIKPANLLITPGGVTKLLDFGVARIQDSGEATRTQGAMVGTLKYMSPEQVEGKGVDAATDIFASGIVLYQLLTDRRPFDGDSYSAIVQQIVQASPEAPSRLNPMLPGSLDAVVAKALAKDRQDRYATAADFAQALRAAVSNADPTITPVADPARAARRATEVSTASGLGSGVGMTSGGSGDSAISQELELVYWKDVKDSEDLEDIEGFLRRFPEGVYADLAKRRLKRIMDARTQQGLPAAYEQTAIHSLDTPTDLGLSAQQAATTVTVSDPTVTQPFGVTSDASAPVSASLSATPSSTVASTAASIAPADAAATADRGDASVTSAAPSSRAVLWIVAALAVLVAGAAWFFSRPAAAPPGDAGLSTTLSITTPTATVSVPEVSATLSNGETLVTAPTASASAPKTSTTGLALSPTTTASISGSATSTLRARTSTAPVTASASVRRGNTDTATGSAYPSPSDTPTASGSSNTTQRTDPGPRPSDSARAPSQLCEGKVLFSYLNCMRDQCAKPQNRGHSDCERWRKNEPNTAP
jgi:eukaryotic-like serine/threonine-protein kinase